MAEGGDSAQDKTEEPTPKKLSDAREKGDVANSREFANFIVFLGLSIAAYFSAGGMMEKIVKIFQSTLEMDSKLFETTTEAALLVNSKIYGILLVMAPIFAAVFAFGIASYVGQFGLLFTGEKIKPTLDKISPLKGLKRIFSAQTAVELLKSIVKVIALGYIFYLIWLTEEKNLLMIANETVPEIFMYLISIIGKFAFAFLVFLAILGILDFAYQRHSYNEKMKMSIQEVRDEMKQREGDPHVKARIRQLQRETARAKMMSEVPTADVVVANPTHVAVALKYKRGQMMAPMVVAKGAGFVALAIKEKAILNGVPVLEKRSLARFLFRNVEINEYVPESLFKAVAEVLAYVYKMKQKYRSLGGWTGDYQPGVAGR